MPRKTRPPSGEGAAIVGRNTAIKRYDVHPEGQPTDLFATGVASPAVAELLRSPWVARASALVSDEDGRFDARSAGGKRVEREVDVEWDGVERTPIAFTVPGRRGRLEVDALVGHWVEERFWWREDAHVSRRCFRVLARGGVWDLAYDRLGERWLLVGIGD